MHNHPRFLGPAARLVALTWGWALCACGTTAVSSSPSSSPSAQATQGTAAPTKIEMEPLQIQASQSPAGLVVESFDAQELFERAGAALSSNQLDDAIRLYDRLLTTFPASSFARPGLYNQGLAFRDKKDWNKAVESFQKLANQYPTHGDAKDALFQLGACYAELENWPSSGEVFARLLDRTDLTSDDRIEALARRGFAQLNLADLDTAEKTFWAVHAYKHRIEKEERLQTDFFLAFSHYNLGQISHKRFNTQPLRLPEKQMDRDLEQKASLLLQSQRYYIETIKYGNPRWASAAGFQVGSLYEEMYDAFMGAPIPPELDQERREIYQDELRKKVKVLLQKALRWQRENLLMMERFGVDTDWAEKSRLAYAKLARLIDPNAPIDNIPGPKKPLAPSGNGTGTTLPPALPPAPPSIPERAAPSGAPPLPQPSDSKSPAGKSPAASPETNPAPTPPERRVL